MGPEPVGIPGKATGRRRGRNRWLLLVAVPILASAQSETTDPSTDLEAWYESGRQIFDDLAPPALKEAVRYPTKEEWDAFWQRLESTLHSDSLVDWAWLRPEAERALELLQIVPGAEDTADWLRARLDFLEMAEGALQYVLGEAAPVRVAPAGPGLTLPAESAPTVAPVQAREAVRTARTLTNWTNRMASRPVPANAKVLVPRLKPIFSSEGVPPEWVWLAEVESSFNPRATSPVGARGLFQFMPATAERFGMKASRPDQRTDPERSARAAAQYLRILYRQLGSWPLALAAYNAGEGRVGRLLKKHGTTSYEGIVDHLPTETQMYVPKVVATVAVREGIDPLRLPGPAAR